MKAHSIYPTLARKLRNEGKVLQPLGALADADCPIALGFETVFRSEDIFTMYLVSGLLQEGRSEGA